MSCEPLSPWRFRLTLEECPPYPRTAHEGPIGALVESGAREARERDGRLFRDWRVTLGLGLQEVAAGWGVSAVVLGELERGERRFPSPADAWGAQQQLFTWACERHGYSRLGSPAWRTRAR